MVIVDTSVLIDYFGNRPTWQVGWLDRQIGRQRLGVTSLILAEVLQGIQNDKAFEAGLDALSEFELFESVDSDLAIASAQNYRLLRKRELPFEAWSTPLQLHSASRAGMSFCTTTATSITFMRILD